MCVCGGGVADNKGVLIIQSFTFLMNRSLSRWPEPPCEMRSTLLLTWDSQKPIIRLLDVPQATGISVLLLASLRRPKCENWLKTWNYSRWLEVQTWLCATLSELCHFSNRTEEVFVFWFYLTISITSVTWAPLWAFSQFGFDAVSLP